MTKNSVKISAGIRALTRQPNEIISGVVVAGSVDEGNQTISVIPDGQDKSNTQKPFLKPICGIGFPS